MAKPLRLLLIGASPADADLIARIVRAGGYELTRERVDSAEAASDALDRGGWDIVIADYRLPGYEGPAALAAIRKRSLDLPVIFIADQAGDHPPTEVLHAGATDFILKDSLARLVPAIQRDLRDTEQRRKRAAAEAALRASEERLQLAVRAGNDVLWDVDPVTRAVWMSPSFNERFGYPPGTPLPDLAGWIALIHPEDRARVETSFFGAITDGVEHWAEEYRMRTGDGGHAYVADRGLIVRDRAGRAVRIVGSMVDITAYKRTEAELRARTRELAEREVALQRSEARFRSVVENTLDVVTILRPDGIVTYESPSIEAVLGYSPAERVGTSVFALIHPDDLPHVQTTLFTALAEGRGSAWTGFRSFHRDGSLRYLEAVGTNLLDEPAVSGIVIITRDVTERVQLEEQLRQSQKVEAVGRLAGGIAHDFNNILTAMSGHVELLIEQLQTFGLGTDDADEIRRGAERAASLTRQLLAFSRKQVLQPRVLDLNQLIRETGRMLGRLIGEDVRIELRLDAAPAHLRADPGQLEQVLLNLAVNARDAMPSGGTLTISTADVTLTPEDRPRGESATPGHYIMLAVADTGTGMTRDVLERAFDPFFTTKEQGRGTGLGLSTVHGIVAQSGGHIHVTSVPDRGTTFEILLPSAEEELQPEARRRLVDDVAGTGIILLVEDEPSVRSLVKRVLLRRGYAVLEAADGDAALHIARTNAGQIDLLLTDVVLPGINGVELSVRFRELQPDARILFTSGYTEDEVVRRGLAEHEVEFLPKPFSPQELVEKVRDALHGESLPAD